MPIMPMHVLIYKPACLQHTQLLMENQLFYDCARIILFVCYLWGRLNVLTYYSPYLTLPHSYTFSWKNFNNNFQTLPFPVDL